MKSTYEMKGQLRRHNLNQEWQDYKIEVENRYSEFLRLEIRYFKGIIVPNELKIVSVIYFEKKGVMIFKFQNISK